MEALSWVEPLADPVERARAAYPQLAVDRAAFAKHWSACVRTGGEKVSANAEDVYLAFSCAQGDRQALALVEERYLGPVGRYIGHLRREPSFVDEVRQQLRERLLIGVGPAASRMPKILNYTGRGSLAAWIRVAAVRHALDLIDKEKSHRPLPEHFEDDVLAATVDPEMIAIRQRHLPQFREAFRRALSSLGPAQRNLLRFYLVDGLNIARIGEIFGKSRATAGRMVVECREKLLEETRRQLGVLTGAPEGDVLSLIRLLQSQLDVSIRGFLRNAERD